VFFYGYQESGYDENGYIKYKDNDGVNGITESDKAIIGDPNPDFIYGITSNLSWKGFGLDIYWTRRNKYPVCAGTN
jgi:TonB-dependent starch-binding outer membrane protein SusC